MLSKRLLFIPTYRCAAQIERTVKRLTPELLTLFAQIIIVDNRSFDGTLEAAKRALAHVVGPDKKLFLNDANYGLGGSHKVAFNYALDHGFDECVVLHGDDQGDLTDIAKHLMIKCKPCADWLLGARFTQQSRLEGYSKFRTLGNKVFNYIYSLATKQPIYDLGSGLNVYSMDTLVDRFYLQLADDLTFNYHMILHAAQRKLRLKFVPISWRELDQISNVKLVSQSLLLAKIVGSYLICRKHYIQKNFSNHRAYTSTLVFE